MNIDGNRGYFGQGNVKLLVRSDTYPGDTNFTDSSSSFGQNEVDGDFIKSIISKTSREVDLQQLIDGKVMMEIKQEK